MEANQLPIFKVTTTLDKRLYKELSYRTLARKTILFPLIAVAAVTVYLLSIKIFMNAAIDYELMRLYGFLVILVICLICATFFTVDKSYKQTFIAYGKRNYESDTEFFEDSIHVKTVIGSAVEYSYNDITKIISSKNLYALRLAKTNSYIAVDKNGFSIGESKEFLAFINKKIHSK